MEGSLVAKWSEAFALSSPVGHALVVLALISVLGAALGTLKIRGIGLGIAMVLFVGLVFGHFGIQINEEVRHFARETGLVLFVYAIGIQVGPGLINSLRQNGMKLNLLAVAIIALDLVLVVVLHRTMSIPVPEIAGVLAGAVTNTPSLAAAQQVLQGVNPTAVPLPGLGYAMAYPGGVLGIIGSMILLRLIFRIDPKKEAERSQGSCAEPLQTANVIVANDYLDGATIGQLPSRAHAHVVISRHSRDGAVGAPLSGLKLRQGDILLAVGTSEELKKFISFVGREAAVDLRALPSPLSLRRIVVTRREMQGRCVGELAPALPGVALTRIRRGDVELAPTPDLRLQVGDVAQVVGEETGIQTAIALLGNSTTSLNHPQMIPIALGIALGVAIGSVPIPIPGLAAPLKLGLAGGPLLVALFLSALGRIGPMIWYLPASANFILKEVGIITFLACVGLKSGEAFVETLLHGGGVQWMLAGLIVTMVPLLTVGILARIFLKTDFLSLCGVIAGSMTDPPALAFAGSMGPPQNSTVAYATVYPLVMVLRVVTIQVLILLLMK